MQGPPRSPRVWAEAHQARWSREPIQVERGREGPVAGACSRRGLGPGMLRGPRPSTGRCRLTDDVREVMAKKDSDNTTEAAGADGGRRFLRYGLVLVLTAAVMLAWVSLLTFSPTDPPAPAVYPPKRAVDNAAGLVGAHVAYALRYWLGAGVYVALGFGSLAAATMILGGRVGDVGWRLLGLLLLVTAAGVAAHLHAPSARGAAVRTAGGVLGIGLGDMLHSRFGSAGAWIVVIAAGAVGLMFTADNLVLRLPGLLWRAVRSLRVLPQALTVLRPRPEPAGAGTGAVSGHRGGTCTAVMRSRPRLPAEPQPTLSAGTETPGAPAQARRSRGRGGFAGGRRDYALPSLELLAEATGGYMESQEATAAAKREVLQQTLNDFGVEAEVQGYMTGPVITLYEVALAAGVKASQVSSLATDVARALAVPGVRIVPPRFGKHTVGIEVPNPQKEIVRLKELMMVAPAARDDMELPLYLGKDAAGEPIVADLASMPHMLLAGTTGSGKSVSINGIIMSTLLTRTPQQVRLILVDPKMVELAAFEKLPHLLCPLVNDMHKAEEVLAWAAQKMDERYELLREARVRNLKSYNALRPAELYDRLGVRTDEEKQRVPHPMPRYIIIIDELADLMMTNGREVETHIIRIAQKARAVGIHMVLATQRPSVNVVTGLIKSNMPCRASFRVASRQESRIVLDQNGAEVLLGQGDMLFLQPGTSTLVRAQGTFVDDVEIRNVVQDLRDRSEPQYETELMRIQSRPAGEGSGEKDELFDEAVEIVLTSKRGSVSLLQRRLQVGYSRASRIIDQMAEAGILGEYKGSQARECLMTLDDWHQFQASVEADQSGASAANGEPTSA